MSEKVVHPAEYKMMSTSADAQPEPTDPEHLRRLHSAMLKSARGGSASVPEEDAEDLVQEALIKYIRRPGSPGVAEEAKAFAALRDVRAEFYRKRGRRLEELSPDRPLRTRSDPDQRLVEALLAIEHIAGREARLYCELKGKGLSQSEIASRADWSPRRAGAAYKQFQRHHEQIAAALAVNLKEPNGT